MKRKHFILALVAMLMSFSFSAYADDVIVVHSWAELKAAIEANDGVQRSAARQRSTAMRTTSTASEGTKTLIEGTPYYYEDFQTSQIKLGNDVVYDDAMPISKNNGTTLDLNGYKVLGSELAEHAYPFYNYGKFLVVDNSEAGTGAIYCGVKSGIKEDGISINEEAVFVMTGGNIICTHDSEDDAAVVNYGIAYITGGTIEGANNAVLNQDGATMNILSGALITGKVSGTGITAPPGVYTVATIGTTKYGSLEAAINAAVDNDVIVLVKDVTGDVTITQKADVDVTIDGAGKTFTGVMTIDGANRHTGAETLTIKNVVFQAVVGKGECIASATDNAYAHNVTIEGCTFKGNDTYSKDNTFAIRFPSGGVGYDLTVQNCTADDKMFGLLWVTQVVGELIVDDCTAEGVTEGIVLTNTTKATITNTTIDASNVAIRAGQAGAADGTVNDFRFGNNTLKSDNIAIQIRGNATDANLSMEKNAVSGTTHISGNTADTKIAADANYWGGFDNPKVDGAEVTVNTYYSDEARTDLVRKYLSGDIIGYTGTDRIYGEVWANANSKLIVKVLAANGDVMGTATLKNTSLLDGDVQVSWYIRLNGESSNSWDVVWSTVPTVGNMPAKVQLWIDDAETAVAEGAVVLNAPDDLNKINVATTDADGRILGFHTTIDAALKAVKEGEIITLLHDYKEDVVVTQAPNVKITIDGNNKTFAGTITVDGKSQRYETAALTIKNVNFDATAGISADACINLGAEGNNNTRYTNNVTVENCTFTDDDYTAVAIKSYTGGDYNVQIINCTANGMHSLAQLKNVEKGLVISGNTVNTKNGINLNQTYTATITDNEINVKGYAVRIGEATGGNITLTENTLKTDNSEGDPVIELRGTVEALNMEKNVVSGDTHIKGTATTVAVDANYWDGKEQPVVSGAEIKVNSYYPDEALSTLVRNEMGSINAFVSADRITGDVTSNAKESLVVKVLGADNTVIGTSTLKKTEYINGFNKELTWRINLGADDSDSWAMTWEEDAPSITNMPAKVKLYVDGKEIATAPVKFTANGDGASPVFAAKTDADGKILSFIACDGEFNLNNANAKLAEVAAAAVSGDIITLIENGAYTMPEFAGKELTIKALDRENTSITDYVNKGSQGMMGSTVHFVDLTINGATENYYGLFHTAKVTYTNCIINGLRFLYATEGVTFDECEFNAEGVEHSFWTYGASNVTVKNSSFTYTDRAVNCYSENGANHEADITFEGCSFTYAGTNDTPEGAVEINSGSAKSFDIAFTGCTAPEKGAMWFNSKWDNEKGENTIVKVNGVTVWEVPVVAKIGDVEYKKLQKAINAVKNGEEIILVADCNEAITFTQTKDVSFVLNGNGKEMTGNIKITARAGKDAPSTLVIKNFNFKTTETVYQFIESTEKNYYPNNITIQDCTFEGPGGDNSVVAVNLKSANNITIKDCTGTGLHSFLQNYAGWNLTINNVDVNGAAEGGFALGTVQGVTVTNCEINSNRYGIRLDGQYNNNAVIADNEINAFIPVVVRRASVDGNITFSGTNDFTATNNDGLWCAIGTTEYKESGTMPTAATGRVKVTLNDTGLNAEGIYGNFVPAAKIGEIEYATLADAIAAANAGDVVKVFAGTYAVPTMKAGITIEGEVDSEGKSTVLLEGTLSGTLDNLTLKNLHIKGGNAQRWAYANGNLVFENVTFEATSVYAIHFDGIKEGTTLLYKNCTIIGWAALGGSPESCKFEGCTIKDNGTYGVIRTYFDTEIKDCTFDVANAKTDDVYQDGIHVVGDAEAVVDGCTNTNGEMTELVNISGKSVVVLDGVEIKNFAKIGDTHYRSFAEALNAVQAGETITLIRDVTVAEGETAEINGFNLTAEEGVKLINNGTVTVTGEAASLNIATFEGNPIELRNGKLVDSNIGANAKAETNTVNAFGTNNISGTTEIGGILSVGYSGSPAEQVVVNITGNFKCTNVLVGSSNESVLNLGVAESSRTTAHFGQLGAFGDVNVANADVTYGYAFIRNDFKATNSTFEIKGGVNTYFSGNAKVVLDNSTWNLPGYANIGSYGGYMYGNADVTLKNGSSITATNLGVELQEGKEVKLTLEDTSSLTATKLSNQGSIVLASTEATITANSGVSNITTTVADYKLAYVDGAYKVVAKEYVAYIGTQGYESLAEALTAAADGATVSLSWAEGNPAIAMNGAVFGKSVTITGNANVDWSKGWLYVGRGGEGNATVTFDNANLTSASSNSNSGLGIHVSGREKNTNNKYDGTLVIKNSTIALDYLINRGAITVDGATLTVKNGFGIAGRPASETESGADATATITLENNAKLVVNNHQGMGLGQAAAQLEGYGVMNVNSGSTFETTQAFNVSAKGQMNVNGGTVKITGNLANNGTVYVAGASTLDAAVTGDGWFYMNGVTLGADTKLNGAKVAFINGENTVKGSTIKDGWFSVGIGQNAAAATAAEFAQANGITLGDVTVNVSENANIGGNGETYSGWVGSAYSADKTQHTYALNVENSLAAFGYMHVSKDGTFTVDGRSADDNKYTYDNANVNFYAGDFIINGVVTLNNADVWARTAKISVDHVGGVLNINGDTKFEASRHNGATTGDAFVYYKAGEVNVAETATVEIDNATKFVEGAVLNIAGNVTAKGAITGNGAINFTAMGATLAAQEGLTINHPFGGGYQVERIDGVYRISHYVASVNGVNYESLEAALKALTDGANLTFLEDITVTEAWDCRYNGAKITAANVTIDGNGKTLKLTGAVDDKNWNTVFRFEGDNATVKNLTIDASAATGIQRGITAKFSITVNKCTIIGNGTTAKRAIIFGEGAGTSISNVVATVTNSTFKNWSYGVSDNQNNQDAKSVTVSGNTFENASVLVSASENVTFEDNVLKGAGVNITSYTNPSGLRVHAAENTLDGTQVNKITVDPSGITAQGGFSTPVAKVDETVKYYLTLDEAIAAANGNTVTVLDDIRLATAVEVNGKATLNLNGNSITPAADATMTGGPIRLLDGAELTINGEGEISNNGNENVYAAVSVLGNNVKLTVNGGKLIGYYYGIAGNGYKTGTEVTINGGVITSGASDGLGIYHPQAGVLTVIDGEITGATGIYFKGGKLDIQGGTIKGTGASVGYEYNGSGCVATGDALVIENAAANGYAAIDSVSITGGTFHSVNAAPVASYAPEASDALVEFIGEGCGALFNNTFDESLLVVGYQLTKAEGAKYFGVEHTYRRESLTIVDGAYTEFVNKAELSVDTLTYERTFSNVNAWQSLYVPFEIPVEELTALGYEAAYLYDVHSKVTDGTEVDPSTVESIHLVKIKMGTLRANYPYMIRATKDADLNLSLVLKNTTLFTTAKSAMNSVESSTTTTRYIFAGTYTRAKRATLTGDDNTPCYAIWPDGIWYPMSETNNLGAFRVFMYIEAKNGSPVIVKGEAAQSIKMRVIGEENEDGTTTIYDLEADYENVDYIYDLQGRRVLEPQEGGLYIVNGKKVLF